MVITLFILKSQFDILARFLYMTGILGLSGCIVVFKNFGNHDKGWALIVSLVSACIEMMNVCIYTDLNVKCFIALFRFLSLKKMSFTNLPDFVLLKETVFNEMQSLQILV